MSEEGKVNIHGRERKVSAMLNGYDAVHSVGGRGGKTVYMHKLIAEKALGKPLPRGSVVHHIDSDKRNNANNNLVICQDTAYHHLLHRRQRALDATGDPKSIRCEYCGKHGADKERSNRPQTGWHYECKRKYERAAHRRRKST